MDRSPALEGPAGPWRLKVRVLDGLHVERDGQPLPATTKPQRKPLDLLTLLAAHGSSPLSTEAAIGALWPSLDAEAPRAALDMAVSRLRRLLQAPAAVCLRDGQISLCQRLVWTDVAAVSACLARAQEDEGPAGRQALHELLALYRRPLTRLQEPCAALALRRSSLASAFERVVGLWGRRFEAQEHGAAAAELYRRALECEPLAEDFHNGLMRCHLQRGAAAEALRAFRACAQLLHQVMGMPPSAETRALAEQARALAA
jgi:DNA-binding SARP family transcriptional activator